MGSQVVGILGVRNFADMKMEKVAVKNVVTERTVALFIKYLLVALHSVLKLQLKGFM